MRLGRFTPVWAVALAALALLTAPLAARAAPSRGVSYSSWAIDGSTVHLRFTLPSADARDLAPAGAGRMTAAAAAPMVAAQVAATSRGGDCPAIIQNEWVGKIYTLSPVPGLYRFEIIFACPDTQGIVLHDHVLFDRVPGHLNYAKVQVNGGRESLMVFSRQRQDMAPPPAGKAAPGAGPGLFAGHGLRSTLGRLDALCLIGGLLLLARRWRDLAAIAGALALGYAAALALALSGHALPDLELSGAAAGLLAAMLGASLIADRAAVAPSGLGWRIGLPAAAALLVAVVLAAAGLKGPAAGLTVAGLLVFAVAQAWIVGVEPRARPLVFAPAALFGLLDGMGQAADLSLLQLPAWRLAPALGGYDLGALAGATGLAALAMGVMWLARRPLRPMRGFASEFAAAGLVGLGLFWFVSRLYSV